MLSVGFKKEIMFFCRSFRVWGVIIAAVVLAAASPLLMKLMMTLTDSLTEDFGGLYIYSEETAYNTADEAYTLQYLSDADSDSYTNGYSTSDYFAAMGIISSTGDLTGTVMLIFMLLTMYTAGGELKKRSMIIPLNAGLTPGLYLLPKFLLYPLAAAAAAFCGIMISCGATAVLFGGIGAAIGDVLLCGLCIAVFDAFVITLYLTLGLCTAKAGVSVVIIYGATAVLNSISSYGNIGKFHPFTLLVQGQSAVMGEGTDAANLLGSIGITLALIIICYFVTLFVISVKRVDNGGVEEMNLS